MGDEAVQYLDESLEGMSPSAKLVVKVLEAEGELTMERIIECTRLPRSTAQYAIDRLIEEGLVEPLVESGSESILYHLNP